MPKDTCVDCGKPLGGTDRRCYTCQEELRAEFEIDDPDPCPACGSDDVDAYWLSKGYVFRVECHDCGHMATAAVSIDGPVDA